MAGAAGSNPARSTNQHNSLGNVVGVSNMGEMTKPIAVFTLMLVMVTVPGCMEKLWGQEPENPDLGWITGTVENREKPSLRMRGRATINPEGGLTILGTELLGYTPPTSNLLSITVNVPLNRDKLPTKIGMASSPTYGKATAVYTEADGQERRIFRSTGGGSVTITNFDGTRVEGYFEFVLSDDTGESRKVRAGFNLPVRKTVPKKEAD